MAIAIRNCGVLLESGFTGYVGASCGHDIDAQLKMAIAEGIKKIVDTIHAKSPKTKVLLLAVFPRGEKPNSQREKLKTVHRLRRMDLSRSHSP